MSTHTHKPCTEALPVIRLAAHVTPQSLAQALLHACTTDGFFYLADHGIPQALIEEVFAISRGYFLTAGPEQKLKGNGDLGYTAVRQESLDSVMPGNGDVKESYYYGDDRWFVRKGVTQFVPPFLAQTTRREKLDSFVDRNTMVAQIILRGLALALGLEEDYLAKAHTGEHSRLRLLHYPEHSYRGVDHLDIRAGAHTDYGTITLLHQDRVSGLQVIKDGVWTDVPPRPGCVVVNIGDALEFWSGGKFRPDPPSSQAETSDAN
ncbi:hypothetical protein M231_04817 [Tremella mesenterica]|uniref:Fe2OG dioxygenase domain-containing protein n=1 Tax=Tremella mesenterica TaxID=5217 RepID=A0A4Q1BJM8_TREME|nr:hypothetical protein M231_04817 [Tremella mesenterica]